MLFCTLGGRSQKFILVFPFPFHILLLNYIFPITSFSSIDLCSSNLLLSDHKFYPIHVSFTISQGSLNEHGQKWKSKVQNTKENIFIANQCLDYHSIKSSSESLFCFKLSVFILNTLPSSFLSTRLIHAGKRLRRPKIPGESRVSYEVRPDYSGL